MKVVVIGESSGATMEQVMKVYPRHKALVDEFIAAREELRHPRVAGLAARVIGPRPTTA